MNISNINNFIKVKNDILKWFAHAVAQATDVSVAWARIYRWRNERSEFFINWNFLRTNSKKSGKIDLYII